MGQGDARQLSIPRKHSEAPGNRFRHPPFTETAEKVLTMKKTAAYSIVTSVIAAFVAYHWYQRQAGDLFRHLKDDLDKEMRRYDEAGLI